MSLQTIAGPFSKQDAEDTARALGSKNHSVYGIEQKDADGYGIDVYDYYVERDDSLISIAAQIAAENRRSSDTIGDSYRFALDLAGGPIEEITVDRFGIIDSLIDSDY